MSGRQAARAGFVLVGGRSSRMGRDKALLPLGGSTLVEQIASRVLEAAGTVTLIGSPEHYGSLGLPDLTPDFLRDLLRAAEIAGADCLVPEIAAGLDPLCAVYHRRCVTQAESAIHLKSFKMHDFVSGLHAAKWPVPNPIRLANVNTPEEWSAR